MTKLIIETTRRITLGGDRQGALILATAITEDGTVWDITTTVDVSQDGNAVINSGAEHQDPAIEPVHLFSEIVELTTSPTVERMHFNDDEVFKKHLAQVMLMQHTEVVLPGADIEQVGSVLTSIVSLGKPVRW